MSKKIYKFTEKNLLNISLLLILFNTSKTFVLSNFYIRGIFIDIYSPVIFLNYILVIILTFLFIRLLKKQDYLLVLSFVILFSVNILFSSNQLFSTIYFLKIFFYIPFTLILIRSKAKINYNLVVALNFIYIFILILQFITRTNFFPFFPFGFYSYKGVGSNLDFINLFGTKVVSPLGNFPHSNVFAAFLSFLNIFHLKKSSPLFFVNILLVTILGSFSALLFNSLLFLFFSNQAVYRGYEKVIFYVYLSSLVIFFFFFQFKSVSVIERLNQLKISSYLFLKHPFFGTGASTFVYSITNFEEFKKRIYVLQPVHNIFILFLVEYGFFGIAYIIFLAKRYKKYLRVTIFLLFILVFGIFDHFFMSINQGLLLVSLTICLHKSIINSNA